MSPHRPGNGGSYLEGLVLADVFEASDAAAAKHSLSDLRDLLK